MDDKPLRAGFLPGVKSFIRRGRNSPTAQNTFWLGSSSVMNGLLGALASAILARSLGIEEFGTLTLLVTIMNLMTDLGDLGITSTFVRFGSESLASNNSRRFGQILAVMLRMKLLLCLLVVAVMLLFLRPIIGWLFTHVDSDITSLLLAAVLAGALSIVAGMFYPIFQSFGNFRTYSLLSVMKTVLKVILVFVVLVLLGITSVSAALWVEIASVVIFIVVAYKFSPVRSFSLREYDRTVQTQIFSFGKWLLLYQLVTIIGGKLDVFFIGGLGTAQALGTYGAATKITGNVIAITNSYYAVLVAQISAAVGSLENMKRLQHRALVVVCGIAVAIALLAVIAPIVVSILFGEEYAATTPVLQVMCLGLIATVAAYPINAVLFARGKTAAFPIMAIVSTVSLIAGNLYLVPRFEAMGAAIAFSLSAGLSLFSVGVYYLAVGRHEVHA